MGRVLRESQSAIFVCSSDDMRLSRVGAGVQGAVTIRCERALWEMFAEFLQAGAFQGEISTAMSEALGVELIPSRPNVSRFCGESGSPAQAACGESAEPSQG